VFHQDDESYPAATDIRLTEFRDVHEESAEQALAAKLGMNINALNPPDLAV